MEAEEFIPEAVVSVVTNFEKNAGTVSDIHTCQSCGVEDFLPVVSTPLMSCHPLTLTSDQLRQFLSIPSEFHKHLCVFQEGGRYFWIRGQPQQGSIFLCKACEACISATEPTCPMRCIASGKHFGERAGLPQLTPLEERLIAPIRTCITVVKLVAMGGASNVGWGIKGHTISFPHDGIAEVISALPNVRRLGETKVLFVGPRDVWESGQKSAPCRAKIERIFTVRWELLIQWLVVLKHINPLFTNVEILQDKPPEVNSFHDSLLQQIEVIDDVDVHHMDARATGDIVQPSTDAQTDAIDDAVLLADGSAIGWVGNEVRTVVQSIKDICNNKATTFVPRDSAPKMSSRRTHIC